MRDQASTRPAAGKAAVYQALNDRLPPAAFEFIVDRYHGLRTLLRRNPGRHHVLPDFMIIGAAKCGTTSLFDWVCQHPLVARPTTNGHPRKELLYFDYNYRRGEDWYRGHFPGVDERAAFTQSHGRPFLTGEATATYLTHYWVPERAAKLIPDAKLIVTLRNPADRALSAFHMSRRRGLEASEVFEEAIALEGDRLAPEEARLRADRRYNPPLPPPLGYWSYLQRSRYADHVERWLRFYPRHQFLFLEFERLAADPQATLDAVYDFLGLPPHQHDAFPQLNSGEYSSMQPETRRHLLEYFGPYNARLRELTGVDYRWDR